MIQKCAWCGRLRVDLADMVDEGESKPGPVKGIAWLKPADDRPAADDPSGNSVSHGICPECAKGLREPKTQGTDSGKGPEDGKEASDSQ